METRRRAAGQLGPCTLTSYPAQGLDNNSQRAGHVTELPKGFRYNSSPATSGPHDAQWVIWNVYDSPVPEINLVHNLEHGGIAVQYGSQVPKATVDQIVAWYSDDPNAMVVAPLPALGKRIALTAWTADYDGDPTNPTHASPTRKAGSPCARRSTRTPSRRSATTTATRASSASSPDQLEPGT